MSKNLERSLKDRIKAIAKAQNRAFNDVWKALALERFLARLARSDKLENFIMGLRRNQWVIFPRF